MVLHSKDKSLTLDLKSEDGKAILTRPLERANVLISNSRPGVLDRFVSEHPMRELTAAPDLGGYTDALLRELGYSDELLGASRARQVV
jgi:crotonobetainyl-CoA:carnitine CoA-transferase CaiB-like acyl-CoA transferase